MAAPSRRATQPTTNTSSLKWSVNQEEAHFELGPTSPDDDLYILNVTLVAAEYLHLLLRDKDAYDRDSYSWKIRYNACGCDISSDSFKLAKDTPGDDRRRTFIGDRATARIRTNGAAFHEYLSKTSLEFKVLREVAITGSEKFMGVSFLGLKDLADPETSCIKCTMEVVPIGPNGVATSSKQSTRHPKKVPEVRVVIDLEVLPNYFSRKELEQSKLEESSLENLDDHTIEEQNEEGSESGFVMLDVPTIDATQLLRHKEMEKPKLNSHRSKESSGGEISDDETVEEQIQHSSNFVKLDVPHTGATTLLRNLELESVANQTQGEGDVGGVDLMDGQGHSSMKFSKGSSQGQQSHNLDTSTKNDLNNWKNFEMSRFRDELKEKEKAYLRILAEEWSKREEERDRKTKTVLLEYEQKAQLVEKLEKQLEEKKRDLQIREVEVDNMVKQKNFDNTKALEEAKHRLKQTKVEYALEIESLEKRIKRLEEERDNYQAKIMKLEAILKTKEHKIEELIRSRAQWPDIEMERKMILLEDQFERLKEDMEKVKRERDAYRLENQKLARHQSLLHRQRDQELESENQRLRAQLLASQYKKDLKSDRKDVEKLSEELQTLYVRREGNKENHRIGGHGGILHTHFSPDHRQEKRQRKRYSDEPRSSNRSYSFEMEDQFQRSTEDNFARSMEIGHLTPMFIEAMSEQELYNEITRITKHRNTLLDSGVKKTDPKIRELENLLIRLASQRQALQLQQLDLQ